VAIPTDYSFTRYLAAKKSLDDRSLNRHVWESLSRMLLNLKGRSPLRVLEVGCGIGTMLERLLEGELLQEAAYTGIDAQAENIIAAQERLNRYGGGKDAPRGEAGHLVIQSPSRHVLVELEAMDLFHFLAREQGRSAWDLVIAHAFLDLVDLPTTLPLLFSQMDKGGLFYFPQNFDGLTILEPRMEPELDRQIEALYHRTMDERLVKGKASGDSLTGRRLFRQIKTAGGEVLAAGSADWVVFPGRGGYPGDEAYFLHFIIETIHQALRGHPLLEAKRFHDWVKQRHDQIEGRELIYIAHQLDFLGIVGGGKLAFSQSKDIPETRQQDRV